MLSDAVDPVLPPALATPERIPIGRAIASALSRTSKRIRFMTSLSPSFKSSTLLRSMPDLSYPLPPGVGISAIANVCGYGHATRPLLAQNAAERDQFETRDLYVAALCL